MRVLVVAAHPDDEILGAGGTIAKYVESGDSVYVLIMVNRSEAHETMARKAAEILGHSVLFPMGFQDQTLDLRYLTEIAAPIESAIVELRPDVVYTHSIKDLNQDHQRVAHATLIACRPAVAPWVKEVYAYEVPSSSEIGLAPFTPNMFVSLEPRHWDKKMAALCDYRAEMRDYPHPRSLGKLGALAEMRGASIVADRAEAFEVIRIAR